MKMSKRKSIVSLLIAVMLFGVMSNNVINASEVEQTAEEQIKEENEVKAKVVSNDVKQEEKMSNVSVAIKPYVAPVDWAFTNESRPLEQAIIGKYPSTDTNNDGYISVFEANNAVGEGGGFMRLGSLGITGTLDGIENLVSLRSITLEKNQLVGSIPENISNLTELAALNLSNNQLKGEIPSTIGDLRKLSNINLSFNEFSGSIPSSIGNLINLKALSFYSNNLTGKLPDTIGNLVNLETLSLIENNLEGSIPNTIGNLSNLKTLQLSRNNFTGELPEELFSLANLNTLALSDNNFSGVLSDEIKQLTILSKFEIANTNITGDIDEIFESSNALNFLDVRGSKTNQVKPTLSNLNVFLFSLLDANGDLLPNITQDDILALTESLSKLDQNSIYWKSVSIEIEKELASAQEMVDAKTLVVDLLTPEKDNLLPGVGQIEVGVARDAVGKLPEGKFKNELQKDVDLAQAMLDAKAAVDGLFGSDGITIIDGLTQDQIDSVSEQVKALPDGALKNELQNRINDAQRQLDEKNASYTILKEFDIFTGKADISAKIDAPASQVIAVHVNGVKLDTLSYTITEGSTIVSLHKEYLSLLADGTYKVTVEYMIGTKVNLNATIAVNSASGIIVKPATPSGTESIYTSSKVNTGDATNIALYIGMLGLSLVALVVLRKKMLSK